MTTKNNSIPAAFGLMALVLGACTIKEDRKDVFNELDRLRILGIQSEPADIAPGEIATLSVLAYDPQGRALSYDWSWCPLPTAAANGGECALSEQELAEFWSQSGLPGEPPTYDLGRSETTVFQNVLNQQLVDTFCAAVAAELGDLPEAAFVCAEGLRPSVRVRVTAGSGEEQDDLLGLQELVLLLEDPAEGERNQNPDLEGELNVTRMSDGEPIDVGGTLHRGELYRLEAGFSEEQAEIFLPAARDGLPDPEPRRENMEMDWFITAGTIEFIEAELGNDTRFDDIEDLDDAEAETDYAGGFTEFEDFVTNYWLFPLRDDTPAGEVRLFLVARDERDGVGWTSYNFNYEDSVR